MDKFEEYKLFSERTERLSERRQAATQTYLAVNTAAFTILVFLVKDAGFRGWGLVAASLPLFLMGTLACLIWHRIIVQYKPLIGWHYEQLREMELRIPESYQVYRKEWDKFYTPSQGKERFGFSLLEVWLPRIFLALYIVYGCGLMVATWMKWL
jgi:hypothetical protein